VGSVAIIVIVDVIQGNSLAPRRTSVEFFVLDIDTSINDVDVYTFAASTFIFILGESAESELRAVADACETLKR
jgi:hypothetical protein